MTMPLVSVIVPCYNAEKFLPRCVASILAQTETNWELLLIDDGSTDATAELCRSYAERDIRIHAICQENAGVSAARNAGLEAAKGKYVVFLDSDDAYVPDAFSRLLTAAEKENAEITEGGVKCENEDGGENWLYAPSAATIRDSEELVRSYIPNPHGMYACWRFLIRRDFIGGERFAKFTRGEDAHFILRLFLRCRCYAAIQEPVYIYRTHSDSVMHESFRPATLDFVRAWVKIYDLLKEKMPTLAQRAAEIVLWQCDRIFVRGMESGDASWKNCRRELKPIRARFAALCAKTARKRAANAVFMLSPELYYRLAGGHRR